MSAQTPEPLLTPDPFRIGRWGDGPGLFAAADVGLVHPHVASRITSGTPVSPLLATPVTLPVAPFNWTVSPRFELGYRMRNGYGDVRLGYQFLASSGSAAEDVRSRLDLNVVDLDYVSGEWLSECGHLPLFRDLRVSFGVRIATSYLDSMGRGPAADERLTSHFVGAGPRFGLEWSKPLLGGPWELYTRFDAAGVLGRVEPGFVQAATVRRDGGQSTGVEVIGAEAGLGWRPDPAGRGRLVTGYQFQQWWDLGRTENANYDLTVQGVFLRAEWRY